MAKLAGFEKNLMFVRGLLVHEWDLPLAWPVMITRTLVTLGMKKFVILANVASTDAEIGDLYLPNDHINYTGAQPTIGKNIDKWGKRFYDCSVCYDRNMTLTFAKIHEKQHGAGSLKQGNMIWLNSIKPYCGKSEENFATTSSFGEFKINAVVKEGILDIMAIRHMDFEGDLKAVFIGVVNETTAPVDPSTHADQFDLEKYQQGVERMVETLLAFAKTPAIK